MLQSRRTDMRISAIALFLLTAPIAHADPVWAVRPEPGLVCMTTSQPAPIVEQPRADAQPLAIGWSGRLRHHAAARRKRLCRGRAPKPANRLDTADRAVGRARRVRANTDEQRACTDGACRAMITPRQVFRYSVAATAGYTITSPVVAGCCQSAQTLAVIAMLSFVLAIVSIVAWIELATHWGLIYFGICVAFFVARCCRWRSASRTSAATPRKTMKEGKTWLSRESLPTFTTATTRL